MRGDLKRPSRPSTFLSVSKDDLRRPRLTRGMTLVETMVAAAVLSVGVMSLGNLFFFAEEGIAIGKKFASASELARQRVEWLAAQPVTQLPQCLTTSGCRQSRTAYAPMKSAAGAYECSELIDGMSTLTPDQTSASPAANQNGTVVPQYRIDTIVEPHGDPSQQLGAQLVSVGVCWTDMDGQVHEVRAERLLVPEL
jgi:prepilin-type N-terminal cleavage/methylation domain-containing protein